MAISLGGIKKLCKEKGYAFRAASLFGIGKNDSGKCDFYVETPDTYYAVKVLTLGEDAHRVYFHRVGGYLTVKGEGGDSDYMWVRPDFPAEGPNGKPCVGLLLLDGEVPTLEIGKGCVTTVTPGSRAFDCKVYTPATFEKLL